ncbi:beta-ketoacyl reductase, partial [Paractinoplanes brasiliensis]
TLSAMASDAGTWLPVLRRDRDETQAALTALAGVHVHGGQVDWSALLGSGPVPRLDLPTYAFQRERYWLQPSAPLDGLGAAFWEAVQRQDADVVLPALAGLRERRTRTEATAWRYRIGWTRLAAPGTRLSGKWAVIGDDSGRWASALATAGAEVVTGELPADLTGGVVLPGTGPDCTARLLDVMQTWHGSGRLWVVTQGAVAPVTDPWQGQLWGLGRVFGSEQPDRWGGLIDVPDRIGGLAGSDVAADVVRLLGGEHGETQMAVRPDGVFGLRLRAAPVPSGVGWRPSGTVLITGGTGALGARVASWALSEGARRVVLASRRGIAAPGAAAVVQQLTGSGAAVEVVVVDVADRSAVSALVARIPDLDAVLHAAGVLDDGMIGSLTPERLGTVARAKVDAVLALDEATSDRRLSAFVLFSSVAALVGAAGQGNYAAANAFLDAYAQQRRAQGVPMVSVGWGAWAGDGMAHDRGNRSGIAGMDPAVAVAALAHALAGNDGYLVVARIDWSQLAGAGGVPAWLSELPDVPRVATRESSLASLVGQAAPAQRQPIVLAAVREHAAVVLGHADAAAVGAGSAFRDLGFDSLTAVELRNRLASATGLSLPATLAFDYPTPLVLTDHLCRQLAGDETEDAAPTVLDEINKLENSLTALAAEDSGTELRKEVTERLKALLSTWRDVDRGGEESVLERLQDASDDDLFDFLDNR